MATLVAGRLLLNLLRKIVSLIDSSHGQLFRVVDRQGLPLGSQNENKM